MAVTTSVVARWVNGNRDEAIIDVTGDSSYAGSGGETLSAATLGFKKIEHATAQVSSGGYVARYDITNGKITYFYGDNNNASDGPLIEVPSTTDMSSVVHRLRLIGQGL